MCVPDSPCYMAETNTALWSNCVCVSHSVVSDSAAPGLWPTRLLCPCNSPGKYTGVGNHSRFQRIFPTRGSNLGLLHCRQILYRPAQVRLVDEGEDEGDGGVWCFQVLASRMLSMGCQVGQGDPRKGDRRARLRYTASVGMIGVWQAEAWGLHHCVCVTHKADPGLADGSSFPSLTSSFPWDHLGKPGKHVHGPFHSGWLGIIANLSHSSLICPSLSHKSSSCWEGTWLGYQHQLPTHSCLWNKASFLSQEARWPARLSVEGKSGWDAPVRASVQNPRSDLASLHPASLLETPARGVHWPGKDSGETAERGCRVP